MMAHCRTFEENLPAYLEGAIPADERQEIEKHLESCGHCRAALQDLKKTGEILAGLEEKEPPPWFSQQVMTRVREEARAERGLLGKLFFPLPIKVPIGAMASLLVAVLAWYVYQTGPPEMKVLPEIPSSGQIRQQETVAKETAKPLSAAAPEAPAEKLTAGSAPRSEPEAENELPRSRVGEEKTREEKIIAARPAEMPPAREKKSETAARQEADRPSMTPLKKSEPEEIKPPPVPAPALQAAPRRMERELQEKDESQKQKRDLARDKGQLMGKAFPGLPQQVLTVRVQDVGQAAEAVHKMLRRIEAEEIREETQSGRKLIKGVVWTETIPFLSGQLKSLGEVKPFEVPAPIEGKAVLISIEIVPIAQ